MLVFFLACFIPSFLDRETPIPQALLMSFFVALIMGGIFGYIISIIIFVFKLVDCLEKCLIYGHIRRFAD